jgi:hypothetical protein
LVAVLAPYDRSAGNGFAIWAIHLAAFVAPIVISLGLAIRHSKR